jgi:two-component system, NtrC family, response regulator AtoC
VSIVLPPLRERREDILPLAKSFVEHVYALSPAVNFTPEALQLLEQYSWPGNIRELENAVVRAAAMCDGTIRVQDLPERVREYRPELPAVMIGAQERPLEREALVTDWVPLAKVEARYVTQVLEYTKGNKQAAARMLEVDRKTLDRMIKRHNINFGALNHLSMRGRFTDQLAPGYQF